MSSTVLLGLMSVLLVILIGLVLLFTAEPKEKKSKKNTAPQKLKESIPTFEELRTIIKSKASTSDDIIDAYQMVVKHYGSIKEKMGIRVNPDFDRYMDLIFAVTRHKNANTKIVIGFEKELSAKNPKYEREIADAFNRGLSSRV